MICACCSLLCTAESIAELQCPRREQSLTWLENHATQLSKLQTTTLDARFEQAFHAIQRADDVLFTGRIGSVQTARAAVRLAQKIGATVDCAEHGHVFKNIEAIQRVGMNTTTISEARDISDLIVVAGDDRIMDLWPRLPTALARDANSLNRTQPTSQTVLLLGQWSQDSQSLWRASGFDTWTVKCPIDSIPKALAQVVAHPSESPAPVISMLENSRYTTILWAASTLDMAHADLWVERLLLWIAARNESGRCAGIPLTGLDGTFQQVLTWLTGFPGRVSFRTDPPNYEPRVHSAAHWIQTRATKGYSGKPLVIAIDETPSGLPAELNTSGIGRIRIGGAIGDGGVDPSDRDRELNSSKYVSIYLPAAIAGVSTPVDMFRADQCILARVGPRETATDSKPRSQPPTAAHWLERFLALC